MAGTWHGSANMTDQIAGNNRPEDMQAKIPEEGQPGSSNRKVLVVDDSVDAADTLGALIGIDDFDVKVVYGGAAAVSEAMAWVPDVVVMDIGMPGMDGYEAARLIRSQAGGRAIKLIALTGWGQATDRDRASEAGFDHHLVKPIDYDSLMNCLHQ